MGIELPAELTELAARAGVRWPEADEDRMRESAAAWREAARSIEALASDADATAQRALRSFEGTAADAAGREWRGLVDEDGLLPVSVRECAAAADRLEHAADRIGATKVELVRELTALAKHSGAAEQAARAGHPQALAALETAVRGASTNVTRLHETLLAEVGPASGVVVREESRAGGVVTATSTVEESVPGAGRDVSRVADRALEVRDDVGGVAAGAQQAIDDIPPGQAGDVLGGRGEASGNAAEPSTGPIPVTGGAGPWNRSSGVDPASATAPHAVQSAWAAPTAHPPQPNGQPPQAFGQQPAHPGGYAGQAGPTPGVHAQPPQYTVAPRPSAQSPSAYGQPAPPARPGSAAPVPPGQSGHRPVQRAPLMPPQSPQPPQAQQAPEAGQRGWRNGPRNADAVAIVLHQFPIGHLPVASHGASEQLPPAESDDERPGLSFPPQDHPESGVVDDADVLALARSGELYRVAGQDGLERGEPTSLPEALLTGHDPLGELSETGWEKRYSTGTGHVWSPAADFPEGGHEPGQPVVLEPETVLELLGPGAGRFFYAAKTPFAQRSLPAEHAERAHRSYRVVQPLPVWRSVAAPWFEQPGGGTRYRTTYPAVDLVALGYLVELTRPRRIAEASTLRIKTSEVAERTGPDRQEAAE